MKIFFTSSNKIKSFVSGMEKKYQEIGIEIENNYKNADMIVSTENINHINHKFKLGIMMGHDNKIEKCFDMRNIPRTSNAQMMDVISSFAYVLGYQSVIIAMSNINKIFSVTNVTGTNISGVTAMIVGVGVAGLSAVSTLRRMGSRVIALDISENMKDSVESLNAKFIKISSNKEIIDIYNQYNPNLIITSVCGINPPKIITNDMINKFQNCLIVDIAGSNCEISKNDSVKIINGSKITYAIDDMSLIYSNNVFNFIKLYLSNSNHSIIQECLKNGENL